MSDESPKRADGPPLAPTTGSDRRYVSFRTMSEDPNDFCEECHDTGYVGDNGPGIRGNREYAPCECDFVARNKRKIARRLAQPNSIIHLNMAASPEARQMRLRA